MHIAFFSDQHPATLGGLQVSLGLQRKFLEAAGHTVTICAPDSKRQPSPQYSRDGDVLLRSKQWGEHSFCLAGTAADKEADEGFARRPPVDVVHVQADVWGAWNGYRFARRHGLPLAHTMHTNVEVGLPAIAPFPKAAFRLLFAAQKQFLKTGPVDDIAAYVRAFAKSADALIVPSSHFAEQLRKYGVQRDLHVIPTGVDDDSIDLVTATPTAPRNRPIFVWPGRVSEEKRLDDVIRALAFSGVNAELHVYGSGPEVRPCQTLSKSLGVDHLVYFHGAVSHDSVLEHMRQADAVIQSSLGYETQGLTVYEAISVGTPVLVRDHNIAADLPRPWCHVIENSSLGAFAIALRELTQMLSLGRLQNPGPLPTQFRQSELTSRMLDVYEEVSFARSGIWGGGWGAHAA
jgi:Glycosyltransferase